MYKVALIFGLVLVAAAIALFFYGPEASAPVIPLPEESPEALKSVASTTPEASTSSVTTSEQKSTPTVSKPAGKVYSISIENMSFNPAVVTLAVGDMVVWTNKDAVTHTATGKGFDSGNLGQGDSFAFRFEKAGTYTYNCTPHPNMKGTITVK